MIHTPRRKKKEARDTAGWSLNPVAEALLLPSLAAPEEKRGKGDSASDDDLNYFSNRIQNLLIVNPSARLDEALRV